jgi:type III pantothenate kinase
MLLVIDVGNSEITLGLFTAEQLAEHWRLTTVVRRTPDEWAAMFTSYLRHAGHSTDEVRAVVTASVAPRVTEPVCSGVEKAIGIEPVQVGPALDLPVILDVEDPQQVGSDRIVNTLAAARIYKRDTIVVDFGTATTFDCITAEGRFIGGVIAPGLRVAADELSHRAAKLPATDLTAPERVIGRRTEECIRSGVLYGAADSVDGLICRIRGEWPNPNTPYPVATGGLAYKVVPYSREIEAVEPNLTLYGLKIVASHLGLRW